MDGTRQARRNMRTSRQFWAWFSGEQSRFAASLQAMFRGEADCTSDEALIDRRLAKIGPGLSCELRMAPWGGCEIVILGETGGPVDALRREAVAISGWRVCFTQASPAAPALPAPRRGVAAPAFIARAV